MGSLDLSALDDDTQENSGKALRAPHDMFIPDPEQLERERDAAADDRDRDDIKQRGIMQPIIVAEPELDGRMPIRVGHRRWRLSKEAGLPDLPYMFEVEGVVYDDYAKLAENRKRQNESPMDIAKLIVKRKAKGEKNKFIADQIGIDPSEITHHLVLVEGPEYIRSLYHQGKCRTPKYLYELEKLSRDYPAQVEQFCATAEEFTYKAIMAFADSLKNLGNTKESSDTPAADPAPQPQGSSSGAHAQAQAQDVTSGGSAAPAPVAETGSDANAGSDDTTSHEGAITGSDGEQNSDTGAHGETTNWPFPTGSDAAGSKDADSSSAPAEAPQPAHIPSHNPDIEKDAAAPYLADPSKIKKPLLLGTYNGSDVMVMLYKRPTTPGLVFVKHENGTGEEEVEFGKITGLTLTESKL